MRRFIPSAIALFGAFLIQAGFAPYLAIGGVTPNFLMLVVVTLALTSGPVAGATTGFVAGLLFDLLGTGPVGAAALVLAIAGYVAGLMHAQMFAEGWRLPLSVLAVTVLGAEMAYALVLAVLGYDLQFWTALVTKMLPDALYNTVLALLVYPWLARYLRQDRSMTTFRRLA